MNLYFGTKIVQGEPMKRFQFANDNNRLDLLKSNDEDGYFVKYDNEYNSWTPKDVFERSYVMVQNKLVDINHNYMSPTKHSIILEDVHHNYLITDINDKSKILSAIHFQQGSTKLSKLNGCFIEDLYHVIINRLNHLNTGEYKCTENDQAILKTNEALFWLNNRTLRRMHEGVYGTFNV